MHRCASLGRISPSDPGKISLKPSELAPFYNSEETYVSFRHSRFFFFKSSPSTSISIKRLSHSASQTNTTAFVIFDHLPQLPLSHVFFNHLRVCSLAADRSSFIHHPSNPSPIPRAQRHHPRSHRRRPPLHRLCQTRQCRLNNWNCKPSALHLHPLVLVHDISANTIDNWVYMVPRFVAKGYCVFALSCGQLHGITTVYGLDKMENSAQQLLSYVDRVLEVINTTQVDFFGHSRVCNIFEQSVAMVRLIQLLIADLAHYCCSFM